MRFLSAHFSTLPRSLGAQCAQFSQNSLFKETNVGISPLSFYFPNEPKDEYKS